MDRIAEMLERIAGLLEEHLQRAEHRDWAWTALTDLVAADGAPCESARDRVALLLAGIQPAPVRSARPAGRGGGSGAPPPHVDLDLVVVANFGGAAYPLALRLIGRILAFFETSPVLTSGDPAAAPLVLSLATPDQAQLAALAARRGIRGQPWLCYRLRSLPVV